MGSFFTCYYYMANTKDDIFKVVFLGDSGVGKTTLMNCATGGHFSEMYLSTVGVDFRFISVPKVQDKFPKIKLQIWDTAGQERFMSIIPGYARDADLVVLCYSIDSRASWLNLDKWRTMAKRCAKKDAVYAMVGLKCDQFDRQVEIYELLERAKDWGITIHMEISSKNGKNVDDLVNQMVDRVSRISKERNGKVKKRTFIRLLKRKKQRSSKCC